MRKNQMFLIGSALLALPLSLLLAGGNPAKGKIVFRQNCASCHGENALGKKGVAPGIGGRDFLATASDEFIRKTVMQGRPGTAMVPRPDLKNKIDDIIAFLRSNKPALPVKRHVDWSKQYSGDAENGKKLFAQVCSQCHGKTGGGYTEGGVAPAIGRKGFLQTASDDFIFQTLKYGRRGTAMRAFIGPQASIANLSEQEAKDIIAYLRSLAK